MNKEKRFLGTCYYTTECSCRMPIYAKDKDEALKKLEDSFKDWNDKWIQMGGNPKNLIKIDIENG